MSEVTSGHPMRRLLSNVAHYDVNTINMYNKLDGWMDFTNFKLGNSTVAALITIKQTAQIIY